MPRSHTCISPSVHNHACDRMIERGIGVDTFKDAIVKGLKQVRKDGKINGFYEGIKVVYKVFQYPEFKKYELVTAYFT